MLTVIPFSKMILAVLVKLVAPNKPEGNRWSYMMGMSMLMFTVGSAMRGLKGFSGGRPTGRPGGGSGSSSGGYRGDYGGVGGSPTGPVGGGSQGPAGGAGRSFSGTSAGGGYQRLGDGGAGRSSGGSFMGAAEGSYHRSAGGSGDVVGRAPDGSSVGSVNGSYHRSLGGYGAGVGRAPGGNATSLAEGSYDRSAGGYGDGVGRSIGGNPMNSADGSYHKSIGGYGVGRSPGDISTGSADSSYHRSAGGGVGGSPSGNPMGVTGGSYSRSVRGGSADGGVLRDFAGSAGSGGIASGGNLQRARNDSLKAAGEYHKMPGDGVSVRPGNGGNSTSGGVNREPVGSVANSGNKGSVGPASTSGNREAFVSAGAAPTFGQAPPVGRRKMEDIKETGRVANYSSAAGYSTGNRAGSKHTGSSKAGPGFASVAYNTAREISVRKSNGQNFWSSLRDMTGTNNRAAATAKVATALNMATSINEFQTRR